jgi:hypothetical protein
VTHDEQGKYLACYLGLEIVPGDEQLDQSPHTFEFKPTPKMIEALAECGFTLRRNMVLRRSTWHDADYAELAFHVRESGCEAIKLDFVPRSELDERSRQDPQYDEFYASPKLVEALAAHGIVAEKRAGLFRWPDDGKISLHFSVKTVDRPS